ncbi:MULTISPECIES: heme-binding protein [unclassified Microbacterium]|uniref:GlcG/HbpS family heme-binding protein n=1 Tax=unclassified Microbacterium TaxID=2609290 RepID=UPI000C2B7938|nr:MULTISPECIES: heme-binding protein [unclassified Microbacterium]
MSDVTFSKKSVSATAALAGIDAAVKKAEELGMPFVIVVVDDAGLVKASLRMDGAPLVSLQVAEDKAYTAAGFGLATNDWFDFLSGDEPLKLGAPNGIKRLVPFGGGYPLKIDGAIVGGIGVSGGHWSHDMEVAKAGLSAITGEEA